MQQPRSLTSPDSFTGVPEVLPWNDEGPSSRENAGRLCLTESTVSLRLHNLFTKHGVNRRTQFLYKARQRGPLKAAYRILSETIGKPGKWCGYADLISPMHLPLIGEWQTPRKGGRRTEQDR